MRRPAHLTRGRHAPPVPRRTLEVTSADGSRLHAEVHGPEDAPAVVLAHGWTCSTAFWAAVVRELAGDHKVILYDQRGHGRSPAVPPAGYSTRALADDLVAVLEQSLAPGERAVVGGHSMGGMTIMAAAERPELRARAAAVLLCSTGCADLAAESRVFPLPTPGGRRRAHRLLLGSRAPLGPVSPVAGHALRYATMGPGSSAEQIEACARIVHACPTGVRARWGMVLYHLQLTRGVSRLEVPTAVLAGTADRLTPFVHARRLASVLPQCVGLTELPGLGHMTPVEDPDAVAGRLRELVRDHLADVAAPHDERPAAEQKTEQQQAERQKAEQQKAGRQQTEQQKNDRQKNDPQKNDPQKKEKAA